MFMVRRGDVVRMRISNRTLVVHPIHLHGHHALVVARDGVPSTGAAWWVDSLEVDPGESYDLVFVADNPGVWMFHCHNLPHARAGPDDAPDVRRSLDALPDRPGQPTAHEHAGVTMLGTRRYGYAGTSWKNQIPRFAPSLPATSSMRSPSAATSWNSGKVKRK